MKCEAHWECKNDATTQVVLISRRADGVEIPSEPFKYCPEHLEEFLRNWFKGSRLPNTRIEWSREVQ